MAMIKLVRVVVVVGAFRQYIYFDVCVVLLREKVYYLGWSFVAALGSALSHTSFFLQSFFICNSISSSLSSHQEKKNCDRKNPFTLSSILILYSHLLSILSLTFFNECNNVWAELNSITAAAAVSYVYVFTSAIIFSTKPNPTSFQTEEIM